MLNKKIAHDVDSVIKSFEIEDIHFTDFEKNIFAQVAAGKITLTEAKKIFLTSEN